MCTQTVRAPVPWRSLRNMLDFSYSILRSTYTSPKPSFKHRRAGVRASCPTCVFEFILRHSEINLHSVHSALINVGISRRGREVPGSSWCPFLLSWIVNSILFFFSWAFAQSAKCFKRSHVRCACQLPRDVCSLLSVFHHYIWGWGDKLSTPHVPRLHQR